MTETDRLLAAIAGASDILLITHINPDGDAFGSTLATGLALTAAGKNVTMVCDGHVPDKYAFAGDMSLLRQPDDVTGRFELAIALDCADLLRLGKAQRLFAECRLTANVDHHGTNPLYADINIVEETSATGVLAYRIISEITELTPDICRLLYVAISTDTGNFMYSNVRPAAFDVMSHICGSFDFETASRALFATRTLDDTMIVAKTIDSIEMYGEGRVCVAALNFDTINELNSTPDYDSAIAYLTGIDTVKIALFLRQIAGCAYKVSLRSKGDIDVAALCEKYGGGGHKNAAGCRLNLSLEACKAELIEKLTELL